jgi:hypothetical protein
MRIALRRAALASLILTLAHAAAAQTADEVVEKHLAAIGGRTALGKLKSRSITGTITLSTPQGDITGSIETLNALPNKSRTLIKADLTALGLGPTVLDQRFNGTAGYALDSVQGNHEVTGNQLENMRNGAFPTPLLNYKALGATVKLGEKEKVGERDAYVLVVEPISGSIVREYLDAETYLPIKMVVKVDVPQLGREVEQTTEFLDYREVDGIKLPFELDVTSPVQNYTVKITKLEHNVKVDEALFSKPGP